MANLVSFSPLFRSSVGFDRFNDLFETLATGADERFDAYPPYNIEKIGDDQYRITMALAGFSQEDLDVTVEGETLTVRARGEKESPDNVTYLHRGIAKRAFERTFRLADHIRVTGAEMADGLLKIALVHEVPEEKKPRMIPISGGTKAIDSRKKN